MRTRSHAKTAAISATTSPQTSTRRSRRLARLEIDTPSTGSAINQTSVPHRSPDSPSRSDAQTSFEQCDESRLHDLEAALSAAQARAQQAQERLHTAINVRRRELVAISEEVQRQTASMLHVQTRYHADEVAGIPLEHKEVDGRRFFRTNPCLQARFVVEACTQNAQVLIKEDIKAERRVKMWLKKRTEARREVKLAKRRVKAFAKTKEWARDAAQAAMT